MFTISSFTLDINISVYSVADCTLQTRNKTVTPYQTTTHDAWERSSIAVMAAMPEEETKEEEEEKEEQVGSGRSAQLARNLSDTLPISPAFPFKRLNVIET